jgi:uncharacterized protein YjbI with pentapeptide repeats
MNRNKRNLSKTTKYMSKALIKAKAYEIWQKKAKSGIHSNPDQDWYDAEILLKTWISRQIFHCKLIFRDLYFLLFRIIRSPFKLIFKISSLIRYLLNAFSDPDRRNFDLDVIRTMISFLGLFATVFAGLGFFVNYQQGKERLVTDRFAQAVAQIGDRNNETVRIGGIYSLERIANDSPRDYWTIMEILTSYIRNHSSLTDSTTQGKATKINLVGVDIQAILTIIRRRNLQLEKQQGQKMIGMLMRWLNIEQNSSLQFQFDLSHTNLKGANLYRANLVGADLSRTNLESANLKGANLEGANLAMSNLRAANLIEANLSRANLEKINLEGTNLEGSDLLGANLLGANLEGAYIVRAKNISVEQIIQAQNWKKAFYDPNFQKQLGLSSQNPDL